MEIHFLLMAMFLEYLMGIAKTAEMVKLLDHLLEGEKGILGVLLA